MVANPKNWRRHPDGQVSAMRAAMTEIGMADAVLVREADDGRLHLIDGHLRAEIISDEKIPCLVLDVTEAEADKLLATVDVIASQAETDTDALSDLLDGLDFEFPELEEMLSGFLGAVGADVQQDVAPEPPANPVTTLGDLYLLGEHRLLCGDATSEADVSRLLDGRTPFMMVSDPPYGVEYDPEWRDGVGLGDGERSRGKVANDDRVDWSEAWVLFTGAVAYVWHAGRFSSDVLRSLEATGLLARSQIIWRKQHFAMSRGHYHWQHEPCWYTARKATSAKWSGDRKQSTVWDISNNNAFGGGGEEKSGHGTQKPVECMARPIRNHGGPNDDVYDPFLGSGTTIIAAEQLGRRCFGLEIDPAYCDVIVQRWEEFTGNKARKVKA